ncbi:UDP-N-acetylmuramoyl-L-alanyl-D-glutamate--2,6-diaminopimelate ligase [Alkalibacillus haloalkaliphilus]|uniref:UDP-N-acetylmuramoyl-L-alanyl-D-glutamate--2,6-diaminopimelate ligase n=1 Tax=Alkalibacillus haloalkaliphilus TaxID=94136 RepID=A0A511W151_9BACI|nr:UDP-N-acetylmuramoyl-L-alanyl-D-glutamate--2,6-diaminopimelate ligase [Alkalibacillus haloalkaliphilus]GEN44819.1 UDP-N-acetylmuramoyl-L-alanyl-D-glutamate--2,6-diaminopimelate ligase [Alkalibacillus haloalkaliphilus]
MKLLDLINNLQVIKLDDRDELLNLEITSIEMDSRQVSKGSLFVCKEGLTFDGHQFIDDAVEKGAIAIVAQRPVKTNVPVILVPSTKQALAQLADTFYGQPSQKLSMIGITGTNGKTTLTYLLDAIFSKANHKTAVIGTIDMKIGEQRYPVQNTTPDPLFLHKHLKLMLDEGVDTVIMEVSSHALKQGRVFGIDFDTAVYTNLSQDHLDYHPTMEDYAYAKSLLFAQLGNTYSNTEKAAIINRDDRYAELMMDATAQPVVNYSLNNSAVINVEDYNISPSGLTINLMTPRGPVNISTKLTGKFNIYNILAAVGTAYQHNISLEVVSEAIKGMEGVPGRFELVDSKQDFSVIVDYAHTPDSLENVLQTIDELKEHRVITIIGCGGDRDRTKRPLMADAAMKYSDHVIFTSDNPRSEEPSAILADMTRHLTDDDGVFTVIENRREAIERAVQIAEKDDIILIAGKGHETYQEVNGERHHFDDREVAREMVQLRMSH